MKNKYLITSALPYANGPIHFGHIAGAYLPADIFVRYMRLKGEDVVYVCGTDEHGVAITINAEKQGTTPKKLVDKYHSVIKKTFEQFNISFDNFSRTTYPEHFEMSREFFLELFNKGIIKKQTSRQYYCEHDSMFLPDRYVLGVCPSCGYENARGDECPSCGTWIDALELKNAKCSICNNSPIVKDTEHWFLQLQDLQNDLEKWIGSKKHWKSNVVSFVNGILKAGLKERPVTRDLVWGVPVPLKEAEGKVLYVWFDAPIGYISSTIEWAKKTGNPDSWKDYWLNKDCKLIHFIGKDNIPFHTIVFPAMLLGQSDNYIMPENVPANEFYNYEGRKFSTSDGWYIELDNFFEKYGTDPIRFTIIANAPENKDTEFTWHDFQMRNNAELADSLGNFINRSLVFAKKYFDNKVPSHKNLSKRDKDMLTLRSDIINKIGNLIENYNFRKAAEAFISLSREGNKYFDEKAPWKSRNDDFQDCANTIWVCVQITFSLACIARVFMPETSEKIFNMLGFSDTEKLNWEDAGNINIEDGTVIGELSVLFNKIEDSQIEEELKKLHKMSSEIKEAKKTTKSEDSNKKPLISYEDFSKLDLRTGVIIKAESVKGSNKLIRMQIDFGSETRQVIGGLGKDYKPEDLLKRTVVAVYNLKPRKIMGEVSNGMLLAADSNGKLNLLTTDIEVISGSSVS